MGGSHSKDEAALLLDDFAPEERAYFLKLSEQLARSGGHDIDEEAFEVNLPPCSSLSEIHHFHVWVNCRLPFCSFSKKFCKLVPQAYRSSLYRTIMKSADPAKKIETVTKSDFFGAMKSVIRCPILFCFLSPPNRLNGGVLGCVQGNL